ncbi:MAG: hypothetical protein SFZ03_11860 [Candidatus Melainabacteria bacterium]|nr:hypothetical protein [Candidatus Melainabacteria bacterium]
MSYPQGPLEGRIEYQDNLFKRILHGVAGILKDVGGTVIDYAPEILQGVARGLAETALNQSRPAMSNTNTDLDFGSKQRSRRRLSTSNSPTDPSKMLTQYQPSTFAREALQQVDARRQPYEPPRYTPPQHPLAGRIGQASSNPVYHPRLSVDPIPYTEIPNSYSQANESLLQAFDPNFGRHLPSQIPEDSPQIQHNLSFAQTPLTHQQRLQQENFQKLADFPQQNRRLKKEQDKLISQELKKIVSELKRELLNRGEKSRGEKSKFSPRQLIFENDTELSEKLWHHFVTGEGQPVLINLGKLDFSMNLNAHKLFSPAAKQIMLIARNLKPEAAKMLIERTLEGGKSLETGFPAGNNKVTHIHFKDGFSKVRLNIPYTDTSKFIAFGRMALDVTNMEIVVDYDKQIVTVHAELKGQIKEHKPHGEWLDTYDFGHDTERGEPWSTIVDGVHQFAPPGSVSFDIYGLPKSSSKYRRVYSFEEFMRND